MSRLTAWPRAAISDPVRVSVGAAGALIALAFVVFMLSWAGASRTLSAPVQVSYLVSGGFGGATLLIAGAAFLNAQVSRRMAARERSELDAVIAEALTLLHRLSEPVTEPAPRARRRRGG